MSHLDDGRFDGIPPPPGPGTEIATEYVRGLAVRELRTQCCAECGFLQHPPRPICRRCASFDLTSRRMSGQGFLIEVSAPFETFDPFALDDLLFRRAVVQLVEQDSLLVLTKLVTPAGFQPTSGLPVTAIFPSDVSGQPTLAFRPDVSLTQQKDAAPA